jgi:hypothetical protein
VQEIDLQAFLEVKDVLRYLFVNIPSSLRADLEL